MIQLKYDVYSVSLSIFGLKKHRGNTISIWTNFFSGPLLAQAKELPVHFMGGRKYVWLGTRNVHCDPASLLRFLQELESLARVSPQAALPCITLGSAWVKIGQMLP